MNSNRLRTWSLVAAFVVFALAHSSSTATAMETLYDNTERALRGGERVGPDTGDWFFAQPINVGTNDNISSVTINMSRLGSSLAGTVHFSLWDDNGLGLPGQEVGAIGEIDVSVLENVGMRPSNLPSMTFPTLVTGLNPMQTYFVVTDFRDVNVSFPNSVMFGGLNDNTGTNVADQWLITRPRAEPPFGDNDWKTWRDLGFGSRWMQMSISAVSGQELKAGDADQDFDFDQIDLVQVQVASKYLTGQAATWGEGDWNGAPGGSPGSPPAGDGLFNQFDVISAQQGAIYLKGPYAAVQAGGTSGDGQTSVIYNSGTGELAVDAPVGIELTSINIDSAAGIFAAEAAANLGGSFDNDADANIFKATFGSSFGSLSFGTVAQTGLSEEFVLGDLTVIGSLAGGGDLGNVDLVYVPEPASVLLLSVGFAIGLLHFRRANR